MGGKLRATALFATSVSLFWACGGSSDPDGDGTGGAASGGTPATGGSSRGGMTHTGGGSGGNSEAGSTGLAGSGPESPGGAGGQAGGSSGKGGSAGEGAEAGETAGGAGGAGGSGGASVRASCLDWARAAADGAGGDGGNELFEITASTQVYVGLGAFARAHGPEYPPVKGGYMAPGDSDADALEWTLLEAPAGSALSTSALHITGKAGSDVQFFVDKPGIYKLRVIGCADDGRVKSVTAAILGQAVDVPYVLAESESGVVTGTPRLIDSAGDNPRVVGPQFTQAVSSEAEWVASLFEREIAARTGVAHGRLAYPSGPSQISVALGVGIAPVDYEASLSVFAQRFVWIGPADTGFGVYASDVDARFHELGLRTNAVPVPAPLHPVTPFEIDRPARVGWVEAAEARAVGFDIWSAEDSNTPEPRRLTACTEGSDQFADAVQIQHASTPGLVGLLAREGERSHGQLYWLGEHTDGTFDCSATSQDNHLIYQVSDEDESILEFTLAPPYGEIILFVKQLADGRSTELYRAHISSTPEFPPQLLSSLPGRNTGPHYVGPEQQIVWTRTLYEPEAEGGRPITSEIWRMNADGSNPARLIAYPSTPTRAVLATTGMGN